MSIDFCLRVRVAAGTILSLAAATAFGQPAPSAPPQPPDAAKGVLTPTEKKAAKGPSPVEKAPAPTPAGGLSRNPILDKVEVEKDVVYGQAGSRPLKLDVVRPKNVAKRARPAIVFIHGGGWQGGDKSQGLGNVMPAAATGEYVGFSIGYRLVLEARWPAQIHDCKAAIRHIRKNADALGVDPDRICVWGHSAGGHLVSLLGTSAGAAELEGANGSPGVSSAVRCVVDMAGPVDFPGFAELSPKLKADRWNAIAVLLGGPIGEKMDLAKQASPITYVSAASAPFLILHGTRDELVPMDQAERMHRALKAAGADSTLVKIVNGGHGFASPEITKRLVAFFDRHLLGKDVPVSDEPITLSPPKQAAKPVAK